MRASPRRVRRIVWASVGAYAALSLYAAATDRGLAADLYERSIRPARNSRDDPLAPENA